MFSDSLQRKKNENNDGKRLKKIPQPKCTKTFPYPIPKTSDDMNNNTFYLY